MPEIYEVRWRGWVDKVLGRLPRHVVDKFQDWVLQIKREGLRATRKRSGYHDEALQGERRGQRPVRLSRSYRVIYAERRTEGEWIEILEVNKHES